jgi:hypothetical protein
VLAFFADDKIRVKCATKSRRFIRRACLHGSRDQLREGHPRH